MSDRHAICIVVDGLRAAALGTYGNTTYPTPSLDSFASRSLVADWLWADSPSLQTFYRSVWHGTHATRPKNDSAQAPVLQTLQQHDVRQCFISDDPHLTDLASSLPFDKTWLFETQAKQAPDQIENTAIAHLLSETVERLAEWQEEAQQSQDNSLLWLHIQGMTGPWDAPLSMQTELIDEEDPIVAEFMDPPDAIFGVENPDTILAHRVAYAAQVELLDTCLGAFFESIDKMFADTETLVMLLGSQGMALGEHRAIGKNCKALFSEQLHLPWIVNVCGNTTPLPRHSGLLQPADLGATLLEWFAADASTQLNDGASLLPAIQGKLATSRSLAITKGSEGEMAIRTPAWMMRIPPTNASTIDERTIGLYTKPDDRWEFNDVAVRCPEVVEQLRNELQRFVDCSSAGHLLPREPLDADLTLPLR